MQSDEIVVIKLFVDPWKREKSILPFSDDGFNAIQQQAPSHTSATYSYCDTSPNPILPFESLEERSVTENTSGQEICKKNAKAKSLLSNFHTKREWPLSTNVLCHWCCHNFNNTPLGLPLKYCHANNTFLVTGCFCSFNCALAYNNSMRTIDNKQEREHLLYFLAHKILGDVSVIKPAPSPLCLSAFGGCLSIEEFREESSILYFVNPPPMVMMSQQIEEVSEECLHHKKEEFVPLDEERVNKYKERLKLKREKPLHANNNTLDKLLNIKIVPRKN